VRESWIKKKQGQKSYRKVQAQLMKTKKQDTSRPTGERENQGREGVDPLWQPSQRAGNGGRLKPPLPSNRRMKGREEIGLECDPLGKGQSSQKSHISQGDPPSDGDLQEPEHKNQTGERVLVREKKTRF